MRTVVRAVGLALALLSSVVFADGTSGQANSRVTRGNLLRIPDYRTPGTGAQNYFVDAALGADTNTCQASGAGACATIQGAVNKIPKLIRDGVTVSIAAGTYSCFYLTGFYEDVGIQQSTGGIFINGALANIVPATGTATGTATGGTAGSGSTFGTLVDSGQTWTVNNLRGHFVVITGGTGSGQVRVISSNTATAITVVGTWTAPVAASSTYAIQDPSVIVNTACFAPATGTSSIGSATAAVFVMDNNINYRTNGITLQNMKFTNPTGVTGIQLGGDSSAVQIAQDQFNFPGAVGAVSAVAVGAPRVTVTTVSYTGGAGFVFSTASATVFSLLNSLAFGGASGIVSVTGGAPNGVITGCESNGGVTIGASIGYGHSTINNSRFDCAGNSSNFAVTVGTNSRNQTITTSNPSSDGQASVGITAIDIGTNGCGIGIGAYGTGTVWMNGVTGTALANAYKAAWGGKIYQNGANTATGATFDWDLDQAAITGAIGDITASRCITPLGYGSTICN